MKWKIFLSVEDKVVLRGYLKWNLFFSKCQARFPFNQVQRVGGRLNHWTLWWIDYC
jgi:hypothetical protein